MAFTALSPFTLPLIVACSALGVLFTAWLVRLPRLAIGFLFFSLLSGQLLRLPLPGQGGGLLPSDLAVVIILIIVVIQSLFSRSAYPSLPGQPVQKNNHWAAPSSETLLWLIVPFIAWSLFTLLLQMPRLGVSNTTLALAYWLRLSANLLLIPALIYLLGRSTLHRFVGRSISFTALLLVVIGLAQLVFFPDLSLLAQAGWDPHQWRLVSTWLDPNFIGLFLVLVLPLIFLWPNKGWRLSGIVLIIVALVATQSRSAQVAAGAAAVLLSPLLLYQQLVKPSRHHLVTISAVLGLAITITAVIVFILGPRLSGLLTIDPTVELRLASLISGWQIVQDHPFTGVGYNAYQFASGEASATTNYSIHSRAGADNSLLTIWATTGLLGVAIFLLPWTYLLRCFITRSLLCHDPRALAGLYILIALFIHSQFINSWLYSHLLITVAIIISLLVPRP